MAMVEVWYSFVLLEKISQEMKIHNEASQITIADINWKQKICQLIKK